MFTEEEQAKLREETVAPKDNLFEGLAEPNLSFLKGRALVLEEQSSIMALDYFSLGDTLKSRATSLFNLKKSLTISELEAYLG